MTFRQELQELINRHSKEGISDTPDFILASYLTGVLDVFDASVIARDRWHGWREGAINNAGPLLSRPGSKSEEVFRQNSAAEIRTWSGE